MIMDDMIQVNADGTNVEQNSDFSEAGGYVRQHIQECWVQDDDGDRYFDWDAYQELCDQADYWDM